MATGPGTPVTLRFPGFPPIRCAGPPITACEGTEHYPPHDDLAEALDALRWPSDDRPYGRVHQGVS